MAGCRLLRGDWRTDLATLVGTAQRELIVVSPFVTRSGVDVIESSLRPSFRHQGHVFVLTDLSPLNICQHATEPLALQSFLRLAANADVAHLPRVHAKVYVADLSRAIVTSGNLTMGGLAHNYEYGVEFNDPEIVERIKRDMRDYAVLGALLTAEALAAYCQLADRLRTRFDKQLSSIAAEARRAFRQTVNEAEEQLIRLRLQGGPVTTVFEKTILYFLRRQGPLTTKQLHPLVQGVHPDLCDDSVDRVIDGQHFGKKWKHHVRIAQSHLKEKGIIELQDGLWKLVPSN
jgi:hypothetical protein